MKKLTGFAFGTLMCAVTLVGISSVFAEDAKKDTTIVIKVEAPSTVKVQTQGVAGAEASTDEVKPAENVPAATIAPAAPETEPTPAKSRFSGTFWALVPPLFAIALALITKEVYSSLFLGVVLGGCLVAEFNPLKMVDAVINQGLIAAVSGTAGIFIFLVALGCIVALISATGATAAFGRWAQQHVKTRVGAILATFLLGVMIFVDDYFNCLSVGGVMLPVTDAKRVSRAKLAYIIDATAAPVCMIAPISSWAAAVSQYADGTQYSGLEMFIRAIPYNFYSLLTFVFIIAITLMKFDFGPMALHEKNAMEKGDLFTSGGEVDNGVKILDNPRGRVIDILMPVIVLIAICVFALVYVGGIFDGKNFITAFSDTDATIGLPWGGIIALVFAIVYLVGRRTITAKQAMNCIPAGFNAMVPAIMILTLATSLKNMTGVLEAKEFIADMMQHSAANLNLFLPAAIFLAGCALSFATGTSWGTFGILIPIVISIFPATSPLLFIGMSACLAGAICGDHCSPISDTTIMSSAGARCEHLNHVSTQFPYAMVVAAVSFVGFLLAGVIQNWYIVFPVTVALMLGLLCLLKVVTRR